MIEVIVLGFFQEYTGKKNIKLEVDKPIKIRDILNKISKELYEYISRHPENSIILVNGVSINNLKGLDTIVNDEDRVSIMPVVGGGVNHPPTKRNNLTYPQHYP
jgi:molybdopterin converting factor small subunit